MQISKFLVLGTLDALGRASGYDILTELAKRKVEKWTEVKAGSVYFALKQLVKTGEVVEAERKRDGAFPEKALYEITERGRSLFDRLQAEAMGTPYPDFYGFKLALKFNKRLPPEEIAARAKRAVEGLDAVLREMAAHLGTLAEGAGKASDAFFMSHDLYLVEAERRWLEEVARRFGAGAAPEAAAQPKR